MGDFTQTKTFTANTPATAADQNDAWDNLETWANATIASLINDSGYTPGQVLLGSGGGVPTMTTLTGPVSVTGGGATAIAYSEDTQSATISADGVLTGISITPGAGTYLALALAQLIGAGSPGSRIGSAALSLRVNGVNVITGPTGAIDAVNAGISEAVLAAQGIITPTAGQAVEVYGDITTSGTMNVTGGRLVLVRLA